MSARAQDAGRKPGGTATRLKAPIILVTTDFSPESFRALEYAAVLRKFLGGKIHLAHVHEVDASYAIPSVAAMPPLISTDEIERHYTGRLQKLATKYFGQDAAGLHVKAGRAFDQICHLAKQLSADFIVISTHGRTGLKRLVLGSTTERVVQHAPCPVLVVRDMARHPADLDTQPTKAKAARPMHILVPIDFSEPTRAGLRVALAFAQRWKAKLVLLHAVRVQPIIAPEHLAAYERTPPLGVFERAARAQMRRFVRQIDFAGVAHETAIEVGHPAQQICQYVEDREIDLIITSTHGHTGLAHIVIGSVAEYVVRHAHCPVLVVPTRGGGA